MSTLQHTILLASLLSIRESFYRKELEEDVKSAPSSSAEEKRRMMELLKHFEEDTLEESPLLAESDDDGDNADDLHNRIKNLDLDSASYEELWAILTPAEREKFLSALNDPNCELAQQLLASEELEREQVDPWWEAPADELDSEVSSTSSQKRQRRRSHGPKPHIMSIPEPLIKQSSDNALSGPLLLYNICAVCITYAYVIRYFAISPLSALSPSDPDRDEIRRSISQLVPFLVDRKSKLVHSSLSGVVTDLWSRFPPGHMNPQFFSLLLKDTAFLLRPATVTVLPSRNSVLTPSELEAHPSANALRVLSDMAEFFSDTRTGGHGRSLPNARSTEKIHPKPNHVVHKLTFYAAYILGTPAPMLRVLADEATMRAKLLENESKQRTPTLVQVYHLGRKEAQAGVDAKIEELT
ncbi:hypothetical protein BN946_scf184815.g38 [Trametes cinnabarina]|uniref:Uncharacterized protein n=1 Tax=Pycnoporus cinnabarinus TaxID=5643 RepID=A0A060S2L7_PYCCI|nr:hypothetical protein BN946_scf184815.g38 [Trametes cinnabarina]